MEFNKMNKKNMKIKILNPNNLPTIPYSKLEDFQRDLKKRITEEALDKLKKSILKHGIFVPKFVYKENGKYLTMDGHQTKKALISLEVDGYEIPEIPIVEIQAKDRKDAAEKLLQINSRYGTINPDTTFFEEFNIDLSFINEIEIPELDILSDKNINIDDFFTDEDSKPKEDKKKVICPECGTEFEI